VPTVHVSWSASRPPEAYPLVARAIADAMSSVPSAGASTPSDVLVYFDDLPVGDLYVDGSQLARRKGGE
jgi:phenylpyruvate tautomerase PptA (4-oxalocrotonate tautomerase family)